MVMVFSDTFNNVSVISWRSLLLVGDIGVPRKNRQPVASHWQTLSHNVVSTTPRHERVRTHHISGDWYALIAQVVVNPTTIRSRPRRHRFLQYVGSHVHTIIKKKYSPGILRRPVGSRYIVWLSLVWNRSRRLPRCINFFFQNKLLNIQSKSVPVRFLNAFVSSSFDGIPGHTSCNL